MTLTKSSTVSLGDLVRIVSGPYADAEGYVSDIHPECSVMRVHTKSGEVYGYKDAVKFVPTPITGKRNSLLKR